MGRPALTPEQQERSKQRRAAYLAAYSQKQQRERAIARALLSFDTFCRQQQRRILQSFHGYVQPSRVMEAPEDVLHGNQRAMRLGPELDRVDRLEGRIVVERR